MEQKPLPPPTTTTPATATHNILPATQKGERLNNARAAFAAHCLTLYKNNTRRISVKYKKVKSGPADGPKKTGYLVRFFPLSYSQQQQQQLPHSSSS